MRRSIVLLLLAVLMVPAFAMIMPSPTPTPYCPYEYCRDGIFYTGCYYKAAQQACVCSTRITCEYGKCNDRGTACYSAPTPTPTPYCPSSYCSDGVMHSSCYYDAEKQWCYCRENVPCESQRCNEQGTACYSPTPTPTPAATPACSNYCADGVLYGSGSFDARQGKCVYQSMYGCPNGCKDNLTCAEARATPTPTPVQSPTPSPAPDLRRRGYVYPQAFRPYLDFLSNCSDFCADGTHFFNGTMNITKGGCDYKQKTCSFGCASNNRTCANLQFIAVIERPIFFYFPCLSVFPCPDRCGGSPTSGMQRDSIWRGICLENGSCGYSDVEEPCWAGCSNETACTDPCENCTSGCFEGVARDAICFMLFGQYGSCSMNHEETCSVTSCDPDIGYCRRVIGNANFVDVDGVTVRPLKNAVVKASYRHGLTKFPLPDRRTGSNGEITFSDGELYTSHPDWDIIVTVYLQDADGRFEVRNGTNETPNIDPTTVATYVISKTRTLLGDDTSTYILNFTFSSAAERPLARMYYHLEEVSDFANTALGTPINYFPPEEVYAYSGRCGGACHSTSKNISDLWDYGIHIDTASTNSVDCGGNSPTNCEWHEFGHHIMADRFDITPLRAGSNHAGYANSNSTDSWVEGWAEFMSMMLLDYYSYPNANLYMVGGGGNDMETNYQIQTDEEFAVASMLFDLMDPVAGEDCIDLTRAQIWNVIGSQHTFTGVQPGTRYIHGVYDLYRAFDGSGIAAMHNDCDSDGVNNLNEIFIAHGAYYDSDNSGHWDSGEAVGYTKKNNAARYGPETLLREQFNRPVRNGSYIQMNATDSQGRPVSECNATVTVTYPDGCGLGENCDFTYTSTSPDCMLYYEPSRDYETNAAIAISAGGESAPPITVTGSEFNRDYDPERPFVYSYDVQLQPPATPTPAPTATPEASPTPAPSACPLGFVLLLLGGGAALLAWKRNQDQADEP